MLFVQHFTHIILSEGYKFFSDVSEVCIKHRISILKKTKVGSRVSLVAQWFRICLPMQETWVQSLDQEGYLEKEVATTPVLLLGKSHGQRSLAGNSLWVSEVRHN